MRVLLLLILVALPGTALAARATVLLHGSTSEANRVNIVIVGAWFPDTASFLTQARLASESVLRVDPYKSHQSMLRISALPPVPTAAPIAREEELWPQQIAPPAEQYYVRVDGFLNCAKVFERSENGYLWFGGTATQDGESAAWARIEQDLAGIPHDTVIVLANYPVWSGAARPGKGCVISTNADAFTKGTLAHELGHALGGLADEYALDVSYQAAASTCPTTAGDPPPATPPPAPAPTEPKEVNVSLLPDGGDKWHRWIVAKPGDWGGESLKGTLQSPLFYRPRPTCMMGHLEAFCEICNERMIQRFFETVSPLDTTTPSREQVAEVQQGESYTVRVKSVAPQTGTLAAEFHVAGVASFSSSDGGAVQMTSGSGGPEFAFTVIGGTRNDPNPSAVILGPGEYKVKVVMQHSDPDVLAWTAQRQPTDRELTLKVLAPQNGAVPGLTGAE